MAIIRKIAIALGIILVVLGARSGSSAGGYRCALGRRGCGHRSGAGEGDAQTFPTVQIAKPVGWPETEVPEAAEGLEVVRFADGLNHPRIVYTLPNGDVLVTLTRAPKQDGEGTGFMDKVKGWIAGMLLSKAGATGDSPNQIVLLRDADGDGRAEVRKVILEDGLDSPSGMAWRDGTLYVANHNALLAFPMRWAPIRRPHPRAS